MTELIAAHSDIMGGSTAERRINCPGSYKLEQQVPKGPASDYAEEGTALHEAMEDILLNDLTPEQLIGDSYNGYVIDKAFVADKLQPAFDAFKEICRIYGDGDLDFMVEVKGSLNAVIPGAFGTIDILGRFPNGKLLVLDWKFGDGVIVSPEHNMQLKFYAAAALYSDDPEVKELVGDEFLDIIFAIVQPRRGSNEQCWQVWETDSDCIEDFVDVAIEAHKKMLSDNPPLKVGPHCRWCRAGSAGICSAKSAQIGDALKVDPKTLPADPVALSKALDMADQLEAWIKAVRKNGHSTLEQGQAVPGWKLVPKRASRVYSDKEKAEGVLKRQLKAAGAYKPRELISPPQAEKALGKEKYSKLLSKYVTMHSSGTTMARDTDSRPDASDTLSQMSALNIDPGAKSLFDSAC